MAGIVAAATQNNIGGASLGYPLQVVAYKGLDSSGNGDDGTLGNIRLSGGDSSFVAEKVPTERCEQH